MKILILEDELARLNVFKRKLIGHDVDIATEAHEAIAFLEGNDYDIAFFDHDLGGRTNVDVSDKNTGSEVARWLSQHPYRSPKQIVLHSINYWGRKNMHDLLPGSIQKPFVWTEL